MPSMLVMKEWRQFGRSARSSFETRSRMDAGSYSEPLMLRNLLRSWLVAYYHSGGADGSDRQSILKHTMEFCRSTKLAVIPQRLTNIIMTVMDVSNRLLGLLQPDTLAHRQISCLLELLGLGDDVAKKEVVESLESFGAADDALMQAMLCGAFMPNLMVGHPGKPSSDCEESPLTLSLQMENPTDVRVAALREGLMSSGVLSNKDRVAIEATHTGVVLRASPRRRGEAMKREKLNDDEEERARKRRVTAVGTTAMDQDLKALNELAEIQFDGRSEEDDEEKEKSCDNTLGVTWNDAEDAWVVKRKEAIGGILAYITFSMTPFFTGKDIVIRKAFVADENTSIVKSRMDAINW
ncbi:hypothetical protein Pmar_PMAR007024 [Perkinsus marinus ATCC 50983]|uniref:Uncharacterized protein n=1 Tax=Perkinsus marinus (strain ATCC 50983 / TXsc) TaxID=423536 RepID=C5LP93_PERM5|nr:hypothetical protein Pmar_PMAR007024 [Perkinsus marinus ATCC 50983]EER01450.1 hypothetical protein Pmar_PMAR007024 [Perkinsus marinus ATCC 50983]|eukprot:XP_002768732.1 hypothetical protein Pmar_PMAR007024 [Perkinsus marinus ATCC 50983]